MYGLIGREQFLFARLMVVVDIGRWPSRDV